MSTMQLDATPLITPSSFSPLVPGATIGIFGSGQLGRMFTQAAQRMGYRVHLFSTDQVSPTGQVADSQHHGSYEDMDAVAEFARKVEVITFEFENVPLPAVERAEQLVPVRPSAAVLKTVQHRVREKRFLQSIGVACTPFRAVSSESDLQDAISALGCPAVLKTAAEGYDGKGQARIDKAQDAASCWKSIGSTEAILEGFVDFSRELSILAARGTDGSIATYGPIGNQHEHHILDVSVVPLQELSEVGAEATEIARTIVTELDVTGIICVEFFLTEAGQLLVNEIAPRPHNSGHLTIDGFVTSQFEQQVRTVCGMPLGSAVQAGPAAMANLLGDLWRDGEPDWQQVLEIPEVKLHLYGKESARPGRKMGHLTALADTAEEAERMVRQARELLTSG